MMKVAKLLLVGIAVASVGFLLHVVGMATPHWIEFKYSSAKFGLFEECFDGECTTITSLTKPYKAAQAMAILAAIASGAGISVGSIFGYLVARGNAPMKIIRLVSGVLCLTASAYVLICVTVYGAKILKDFNEEEELGKLGYSFGLTTASGILFIVSGILILIGEGYEEERYTS